MVKKKGKGLLSNKSELESYNKSHKLVSVMGGKKKKGKGKITDFLKKRKNEFVSFVEKHKGKIAGISGALATLGSLGALAYNYDLQHKPIKPMDPELSRDVDRAVYPPPKVTQIIAHIRSRPQATSSSHIEPHTPAIEEAKQPALLPSRFFSPFESQLRPEEKEDPYDSDIDLFGSGKKRKGKGKITDFLKKHKGKIATAGSVLGVLGALASKKLKKPLDIEDLTVATDVGGKKKSVKRKLGKGERERGTISNWIKTHQTKLKAITALGSLAIPVILWLTNSSPTEQNISQVRDEIYG